MMTNNTGSLDPEYMHQIEAWAAAYDREPVSMTPEEFGAILDEIYAIPWRTHLLYRWLDLTAILRYLVTGHCGHIGCCHVEPYGFVPEAGCPVHDADTRLSRWARKARKGREQTPWKVMATSWELSETKKEQL